jgi:hypothetical protein
MNEQKRSERSDEQQDSSKRQRQDIESLAKRAGFRIVRWYEDHGLTSTESGKRQDLQKLLADASSGTFRAVLFSEQSCMSWENLFDARLHWKLLREVGLSIEAVVAMFEGAAEALNQAEARASLTRAWRDGSKPCKNGVTTGTMTGETDAKFRQVLRPVSSGTSRRRLLSGKTFTPCPFLLSRVPFPGFRFR